jgi:IS30 family transposase
MTNYTHLSELELKKIDRLFNINRLTLRGIARQLKRSPNSIADEIRKFSRPLRGEEFRQWHRTGYHNRVIKINGIYCTYDWDYSLELKKINNKEKGQLRKKIKKGSKLEERIKKDILENHYRPDVIAGRMKEVEGKKGKEYVCAETIYSWLFDKGNEELKEHLAIGNKKAKKRRGWTKRQKEKIKFKKNIKDRPQSANDRTEIGHLEADSIVSKNKSSGHILNTIVDRKSRVLFAEKTTDKTAKNTLDAMIKTFVKIPKNVLKTVTTDNGTEFTNNYKLKQLFGLEIYFCNPYASWERGTNENTNGLLRRYFPKGTDFSKISEEELQKVVRFWNNYPRKVLGYKTPLEVWKEGLKNCATG